jgi:drug/metabolite transporter (DMT)-like permease
MFYSSRILHEPIQKIEVIGAIILIIGTLIIGAELILTEQPAMGNIVPEKVFLTVAIFFAIGLTLVGIAYKKGKATSVGIIFGLFSGACGSLDPIFKGMGQSFGGQAGLFPTTPGGWGVFLFSFLCGSFAFIFTQWGFARKAQASVLVPCYNSLYVLFPIIIQIIALPGFITTGYTFLGVGLIVIGIILMQIFKKSTNPHGSAQTTITPNEN